MQFNILPVVMALHCKYKDFMFLVITSQYLNGFVQKIQIIQLIRSWGNTIYYDLFYIMAHMVFSFIV